MIVTPDCIVRVTLGLTVHISPGSIVWSEVIVVSLVNVIEAASACWIGKKRNNAISPIATATVTGTVIPVLIPSRTALRTHASINPAMENHACCYVTKSQNLELLGVRGALSRPPTISL